MEHLGCLDRGINLSNSSIKDDYLKANVDDFFLIFSGCLVFFMQAGFAFLEAGSVRSKNTTNILLKNFLNACLGSVVFYAFGFGLAFGEPGNPFVGTRYFFLVHLTRECYAFWFFQLFFATCASTIVSGALAERTEFVAYMISSCIIAGFIFPTVAHWQWSNSGWLLDGPNGVSFKDYAGCASVHVVGGTASLVGAFLVGPRLGRFDENGRTHTIEGHTLPQIAMGGFILFFGFFAFNGGAHITISQRGDGPAVAKTVINTMLSGAMGALTAILLRRLLYRKKYCSLIVTINGGLTGMVSNGAGSNVVEPWGSFITGAGAGVVYICMSSTLVKLKIDDPVHATAVHLGGGLWGLLSAPFLDYKNGIFTGNPSDAFATLGWNIIGSLVIFIWTAVIIGAVFGVLKAFGKLRVPPEVERKGLDIAKHGEAAYPLSAYGHGWEEGDSENEMEDVVTNGGIQGDERTDSRNEIEDNTDMELTGNGDVYIGETVGSEKE